MSTFFTKHNFLLKMTEKYPLILITGSPGTGKTTIIKNLAILFSKKKIPYEGFYTEEVRDDNRQRVGFDLVNLTNESKRSILARCTAPMGAKYPKVGKYSVYVDVFENEIINIFESKSSELLLIDEIGKMELLSKKFEFLIKKSLNQIKSKDLNMVATIPNKTQIKLIDELKSIGNVKLFEITKTNRNQKYEEIQNLWLA